MIDRTVHPNPECQRNQQELLDLLDGELLEMMAYTNRVGNVTFHYYSQREADPTEEDFKDWLLGLQKEIAQIHSRRGYEASRGVLGLRRHAAERNDMGLDAYMRESVSEADYRKWLDLKTLSVEDSHASNSEK